MKINGCQIVQLQKPTLGGFFPTTGFGANIVDLQWLSLETARDIKEGRAFIEHS